MDPLIEAYVTTAFSPEQGVSIFEAFVFFDNFDVQDYQQSFIDLLMVEDTFHREQFQDSFYNKVVEYTDLVFKHHMIQLEPSTPLRYRVEVLRTLYDIQELDDYTPVLLSLESSLDPVEKLCFIIGHISSLPEEEAMTYVEHVDPIVLDNMYRYICSKTDTDNLEETLNKAKPVVDNLNLFRKFIQQDQALGLTLMDNGALPSQLFENYLPYIEGYFQNAVDKKDIKSIACDVLSLLYLSCDGYQNPFDVYKQNSNRLFTGLTFITKVEVAVTNLIGEFSSFKSAFKNEKT